MTPDFASDHIHPAPLLRNLGGDLATYAELVNMLERIGGEQLAQAEQAIASGDLPQAATSMHALKGSVALFGAGALCAQLAELEQLCRQGQLLPLRQLAQSMPAQFALVLREAQRSLASFQARP